MNRLLLSFCTFTLCCSTTLVSAQTGIDIHVGPDGIEIRPDQFITHYQAPPERLDWLLQENIPQDQWPLLFELARAANSAPDRVWESRRQQASWYDVLNALNIPASYFYFEAPATKELPPPYGRAYGYYKAPPKEIVRWSDQDLIKLASVKYISEFTKRPAHEAIVIYQKRPVFINIPKTVSVKRNEDHNPAKDRKNLEHQDKQKHEGKAKHKEKSKKDKSQKDNHGKSHK